MQEDLPRLMRELRQETCPRRVIDEALRRIAAETPPPSHLRYAVPITLAVAGAVLLGGLLVRWQLSGDNAGQQVQRRVQVARQAETALGLIGTALLDAGVHSETVISDRAIPPLRDGLQTAKNKIIRHTEL